MTVIVIGSANLDTSVAVPRHPGGGETILATSSVSGAGGKGLNQAVAAARAGASTVFVGAVGDDDAGETLRRVLVDEGVRVRLGASEQPTGTAFVMVADGGENAIVVVPGANGDGAAIAAEAESALGSVGPGDVVLAQLEVPLDTVVSTFRVTRARGASTVLNAAPSRRLSAEQLGAVDVLIVNQHECLDLAATDAPAAEASVDAAAASLAERVATVVVTLGDQGALVLSSGEATRIPAFPVAAVDTTAAGDTFCGALASRLAAGDGLIDAVPFASAAAALCVQRLGASASAPRLAEISEFLGARS